MSRKKRLTRQREARVEACPEEGWWGITSKTWTKSSRGKELMEAEGGAAGEEGE